MTDERDPRAARVRDLVREAGLEAGEHPAPERLFEYQEGWLTGAEEAEMQDHLALCPECTRMVLELAGTVEPDWPEAPPLPEERAAALWSGPRETLPFPSPPPAPRRHPAERLAAPLAAALLVATLAASLWAVALLRENRALSAPRVNVAVYDLVPLGEVGGLREEGEDVVLPREAQGVLLVLNLADLRPFPTYRAEVLEASGGRLLWASEGLRRSPQGSFTLQLSRPFPGSGRYRIRLFGVEGGRNEPLAEYEVDLGAAR